LSKAICAALLGGAMLAVAAPAANASDTWGTTSVDFGNQNVGSTSDPAQFVLAAICDAGVGNPGTVCSVPPSGAHSYVGITTTGPFAIVPDTDGCKARGYLLSTPIWPSVDTCTLQVTFNPTSGGVKSGTLSTTTSPVGPLVVALKGTGILTGNGTGTGTTKKKCKKKGKKRSASAAKKCKKKKK
jgi:hypothetical protein